MATINHTNQFEIVKKQLINNPKTWCITGVAGFIGSNLLEQLLKLNQKVIGIDNFVTGHKKNLEEVRSLVSAEQWKKFDFVDGDIRDINHCRSTFKGVDYLLHQAALGSVPRSIENPIDSNLTNVNGYLNVLVAARDEGIKRIVYASSSAIYGDEANLPKVEEKIGLPLSPYAVTKYTNELYGHVFSAQYNLQIIGLRYFNIFGPRQDPNGPYAAVIPKWIDALLNEEQVHIFGDGKTSRDFCYVDNAVQANILSAVTSITHPCHEVYNVAVSEQTSLTQLFQYIKDELSKNKSNIAKANAQYTHFRAGDVQHSLAAIKKANEQLGYVPSHKIKQGLIQTINWYLNSNHD